MDLPLDPPTGNGDSLRDQIFEELVESDESLSPTELADRLDTTRDNAHYNLQTLVNLGLVVNDDGEYFCQPVLSDPDFRDLIDESISELIPEAYKRIYIDPDVSSEQQADAVMNCLQAAVAMAVLDAER